MPVHWLIIAVFALLVLGPKQLPDAARTVGRLWREFQNFRASIAEQVSQVFDPEALHGDRRQAPPPDGPAEPGHKERALIAEDPPPTATEDDPN